MTEEAMGAGTGSSEARKGKTRKRPAKRSRIEERPAFDSRTFLTSVGAGRSTATYPAKRAVFRQGDACTGVYFILQGKVKLTVLSPQGKQGVLAILGAGEFFGEGCLAGHGRQLSTAVALESSEIVRVDMETMTRTLAQESNLSQFFISHLLVRNAQFEADLVDHLFNSSEQRLARILLLLANVGKVGKIETVIPKITQDVLAERVGTTRSRINLFMNKFRKLGFIEYNGELKVHSSLLNIIVHD